MQVDIYSRLFRAYCAHERAKNPAFKKLWKSVMEYLQDDF